MRYLRPGQRPRQYRKPRPSDSFAYAGGEIMVRQLPVPDPAFVPPLPSHLVAVPQAPPPEQPASDTNENAALPEQQGVTHQACPSEDIVDNPGPDAPQPATNDPAAAPARRKRTFPVNFLIRKDENGKTIESRMFYAHEWAEFEAAQAAAERAGKEAGVSAKAAREAELAAGRPHVLPDRSPTQEVTAILKSFASSSARMSPASSLAPPPDYDRHSRCCKICAHPDRDAIEGDFVRWRSPIDIANDYGIADRSSIYRHVHATGLYRRRKAETARVMENFLEMVDQFPREDFDLVTRAVRVYAHLDDDGRWFEPPRTHYVLSGPAFPQQNVTGTHEREPAQSPPANPPAEFEPRRTRS